jgi:predicted RNA binding protein YcfA (HicA-like mRNA interferase family)
MPAFGPIKRRELIDRLRRAGFAGPFSGGKHEFMQKGELSLTIPNPHGRDIGPNLLRKILRQAQIERNDWEKL